MKKEILVLLLVLSLFPLTSAWSYDNSESYGDASAYAKVTGIYPECEGEVRGSQCKGQWYTDISHSGDQFKMGYNFNSWSETDKVGDSGFSSNSLFNVQDGRYYFDSSGQVPSYILCAWDYDKSSNGDWSWVSQCGGYLGSGFGLTNVNCFQGVGDCEGVNYLLCSNDQLSNQGITLGKCGVECKLGSDCSDDGFFGEKRCDASGVDEVKDYDQGKCTSYKCSQEKVEKTFKQCEYGCENGSCLKEKPFDIFEIVPYIVIIIIFGLVALIVWARRKKPKK